MSAFFRVSDDDDAGLIPLEEAAGAWGEDTIRGPAVTLALSWALERAAAARPELRGVRVTFDLHSSVPRRPVHCVARVLRNGRRLMLVESEILVDGSVHARARGLFLSAGDGSPQDSISPVAIVTPPERGPGSELVDGALYWSEGSSWTASRGIHENGRAKAVWFTARSLVAGEPLSAFCLASTVTDMSNLVVNWRSDGLRQINADASLFLARPPVGSELGVMSLTRITDGEIAVGTALLFDRQGALGTTAVSAIPSMDVSISYR